MISVLIASMGRPSLAETLDSLSKARVPAGETLEVIVADDSPDGRARQLVAGLELALAVTVIPVAAQNVSTSRNACLDAARGEWLIFVDDDEVVEPEWLEGHLSAARDFGADAVFGPVYPIYPSETPAWFVAANPLFQDWGWHEDGREVFRGRTGNTLIRRAKLGKLRFDAAFGQTGGEDHDFFLRFAAAGHHMVLTDRARAHEFAPAERANADYALRRAVRTGQLYAVLRITGKSPIHRLVFGADSLAKLVIASAVSMVLRPFNRALAFRFRMRASTNLGKLRGISGAGLMSAWN